MFFDLNVSLPTPGALAPSAHANKNGKQKRQQWQQQQQHVSEASPPPLLVFTPAQIAAIEARIDFLAHLGYSIIALNQVAQSKVDARTHVDWLQGLVPRLKRRQGVVVLKRLTVVLDEESDKGNGVVKWLEDLNAQNASIFAPYDILSLRPTTQASFSQACLSHTQPSPNTTHIISIPATFPRLPFHLKHTLVRTALKNGAAFEVEYAGSLGGESERRNWWGGAREVVRVTKGKGLLISGGTEEMTEMRAPRDVANLITLLGIPQNVSHDTITSTPKAIVRRAQSRKTYRSILSEPKLVFPSSTARSYATEAQASSAPDTQASEESTLEARNDDQVVVSETAHAADKLTAGKFEGKKRQREEGQPSGGGKKKKNKKSST